MKIILIVYSALFILWLLIAAVTVYHNIEYYEPSSKMKYGLYGFIWASVVDIALSFFILYSVDWSRTININY